MTPLPVRVVATMIQGGRGGVGRYVIELLKRIDGYADIAVEVEHLRGEESLLPARHLRPVAGWDRGGVRDLIRAHLAARAPKDGLLFVPSYRRVPFVGAGRCVATVHDLAPLHLPEKFGALRYRFLKHVVPLSLRRCAHLITVSQHTADDLIQQFRIPRDDVTVVWNGIEHGRYHPGDAAAALERLRAWQPALSPGFLLYLARIEHPGKGHVALIDALAILRDRGARLPQVVFAGAAVERAEEVRAAAAAKGIAIHETGFVPDAHVADLYRACRIMTYPSRYEGFGLPPVEAMACGAVVAASRKGALSETAGPAAELDPDQPEQMATVIARLLDDEAERARLSAAGVAWARRFDWDIAARRTADVWNRVAGRPAPAPGSAPASAPAPAPAPAAS